MHALLQDASRGKGTQWPPYASLYPSRPAAHEPPLPAGCRKSERSLSWKQLVGAAAFKRAGIVISHKASWEDPEPPRLHSFEKTPTRPTMPPSSEHPCALRLHAMHPRPPRTSRCFCSRSAFSAALARWSTTSSSSCLPAMAARRLPTSATRAAAAQPGAAAGAGADTGAASRMPRAGSGTAAAAAAAAAAGAVRVSLARPAALAGERPPSSSPLPVGAERAGETLRGGRRGIPP
jgi:hypothetical protein